MLEGSALTPRILKQLELLNFRTKRAFYGSKQGGHISPRKGHGIEFSDYRQYELGDNPRHIDWGLYARTDRLYVRRYQEEQDLTVLLLIDNSMSMFVPEEDRKWSRACDTALALGYVALMNQDTVISSVLGKGISPRYHGARAIHSMSRDLGRFNEDNAEGNRTLTGHIMRAASQVSFPGVAIVISDFLMEFPEIEQAFNILRSKNLSISAIQVLGESDLRPLKDGEQSRGVDSETGEEVELSWDAATQKDYEKFLLNHTDMIRSFCHSSGIHFAQNTPDEPFDSFILKELSRTGILE